jgi:serine/threonine protein kinase
MSKNPSLKPGSKLGPFEILELIGKGGMGEVYLAYEESLDRKVAIKIIPKELADKDPEVVKRFDAEGKVLAQLSHPNVVVVHSLGNYDGIHFMSMEFVDGPSLKERIKTKLFELNEAMPLFLQMLQGTEALHRSGIIHRDLKPANVIYKRDGTIKIVDMGIAKNTEDTNPEITRVGEVVGSPMYMSPEVACGEPATRQSDIWGLGLVFYEMLVGKNPFKGSSQASILRKITTTDLDFPKEFYVKYPIDVIKAIKKMCARNSPTRYASIAEAYHDFEVIAERFNRKDLSQEKTSFNSPLPLSHTSSKTIPLYQPGLTRTAHQPQTKTVHQKSNKNYINHHHHNDEGDESQLKIYSLLYLAAAAIGIVVFIKYKDKLGGDVPDPGAVVTATEETSASKKQPISITVQSPRDGKIIWVPKNNLVSVEYSVTGTPSNFHIQIATDAMFSNVVVDKYSPARPFQTTELEPDKSYYLRFANQVGASSSYSDTISFSLAAKAPPILTIPANDAKFSVSGSNDASINFEWKRKIGVDRYRLQVAKDAAFTRIIVDKSVAGNTLPTTPVPPGNYFWRVRTIGDNPVSEMWSRAQTFAVVKLVQPQVFLPQGNPPPRPEKISLTAPTLDKTRINTLLINKGSGRNPSSYSAPAAPVISWSKVRGASNYSVQISTDGSFANLVLDTSSVKNSYRWNEVLPGTHYFRVYARNNDGSMSSSSVIGQIDSLFTAPDIDGTFKIVEKGNRFVANVRWRKNGFARGYAIKVSDNVAFTSGVRIFKSDEESYDVELDNSRRHYIKVAALNESGEPMSQYSKPSVLVFDKPTPVSIDTPRIDVPSDGTSLAATPSATSPVVFQWQNAKKATSYQIQFSKDPDFGDIIFSTRVKENLLVFDKRLPSGKVYWRLRSEKDKTTSPWTNTRSLDVPGRE